MAFVGGPADKVGSEYETWWTLRRVVQLLRGELKAITLEPLGESGAELWVEMKGSRTYDQVKYRSTGQWTPGRLRSDGVLAKLRKQYAAGAQVLLILSQPSDELEKLTHLASTVSSGAELWRAASDSNALDTLQEAWGADRDETFAYLLQTAVRHDGLPHLKEFVELALEMLVLGDVSLAIGVLRRFLEEHVSSTFTAPQVWATLRRAGLEARPSLEPGPASARLHEALDRHVRAVRSSGPRNGLIARRATEEIVDMIDESGPPVVIVKGKAGAGKSVVVAEAAELLAKSGRHVTALRLDRLNPSTSTAAQLGIAMSLDRSPVLTLAEVSPAGFDGVLIIDQLDAVSSYSGRLPDVFEAVDEALRQARLLGNVKVILAVRSVDLEEDPRLRKLAGEGLPVVEVGELDADEVQTYLAGIGVDTAKLDPATLQLLHLPIQLYVFSELDPDMRSAPYRTLSSLYGAYTRAFRTRLERTGHRDEWPKVSQALIERMNVDEALAVPLSVLDDVHPLYVQALVSANVLVATEGHVAMFHETYFDFLFAKSFSARGQALVEWFLASGQGLFRRSQLRQLLAYVAAEEPTVFIDQIIAIVESRLRPHLVSIAYTALGDFSPTPANWRKIRHLATPDNPFADRVLSLVSAPRWFATADTAGDIERLLDDPKWGEKIARVIAQLSTHQPDRVLALLSPRRSRGEVWVKALRSAIEIADSTHWIEFALEQAATGSLDLPNQPFDILDTPLFQRMVRSLPIDALRLLSATLSRDIDRAIADCVDLKDVLSRRGHHSVDVGQLDELASSIGPQFVEAILPLIEKIAAYESPHNRQMWHWRTDSLHRDFDDELFFAFDKALTRLTRDDPEWADPILARLSAQHRNALDFLVCRALHEAPSDRAIDWLLDSEEHQMIGWISDLNWESRRLLERASRTCSDDRFITLESGLMHSVPEHEAQASALRWRGFTQLQLLSALPVDRLSLAAHQRLAELRRKFPEWEPTAPEGVSGGHVQPPIHRRAAERMTDAQWLRAVRKYGDGHRRVFRDGAAFGGADELATLMGEVAKDDPARFLTLALSFPSSTPATYSTRIIRRLAGEVDQLDLLPLLYKLRADHPADSSRVVVDAIDEYAAELDDELFEVLLQLADDADPTRELARTKSGTDFYFGGDFVSAGINSTRGQVAATLARVLVADDSRLEPSLSALRRLANDPIVAVRALAAEPALVYASISRDEGLELLADLLDDDLVLTSSTALRALRWAMLWSAERFAPFLTRALTAADAKLAGAQWANCLVNDALGSAPTNIQVLSESARVGAASALAPNPALAPELLADLFDDASSEVRRQAAHSTHYLKNLNGDAREDLIARLANSAAFADAAGELLDALEELPGELPAITLDVCRRVVETIAISRPTAAGMLTGNLVAVLIRLYRASDEAGRAAALDLIDRTVLMQLWRVDQALDDAR